MKTRTTKAKKAPPIVWKVSPEDPITQARVDGLNLEDHIRCSKDLVFIILQMMRRAGRTLNRVRPGVYMVVREATVLP